MNNIKAMEILSMKTYMYIIVIYNNGKENLTNLTLNTLNSIRDFLTINSLNLNLNLNVNQNQDGIKAINGYR